MAEDVIHGQLLNVIDGQNFNMRVTHLGKGNRFRYKQEEAIRVKEVKVGEQIVAGDQLNKEGLEKILTGHALKCLVESRNKMGSLVSKIRLL